MIKPPRPHSIHAGNAFFRFSTSSGTSPLRAKVFREASLSIVANNATALRVTDAEVAQLALRMRASSELTPEVAVLVLEKFGERLPVEAQHEAIASIIKANASHALAAMRYVNFSSSWREKLLGKIISDATYEDFDAARLSREALQDLLTPTEMRSLIAVVITRSRTSKEWLNFAVRVLPVRAMTAPERKTLLDGLLFENTKSALEFVSEHRFYLGGISPSLTSPDVLPAPHGQRIAPSRRHRLPAHLRGDGAVVSG